MVLISYPERAALLAKESRRAARQDALRKMDGRPLHGNRVDSRFAAIRQQTLIGLGRQGEPTMADRGLLAIRTGSEDLSHKWPEVPSGETTVTYTGNYGSTNWTPSREEKMADGSISKEEFEPTVYRQNDVKRLTLSQFVDNMVTPLVGAYREREAPGTAINVAVKFGFPHINREVDGRTDAILVDVRDNGEISKNWVISDWDRYKGQEVNITEMMTERLIEQGVNVASILARNDTVAASRDENAKQKALEKRRQERDLVMEPGVSVTPTENIPPELVVLDAAFVGGGGTNGSARGINLEIGRAQFTGEDVGEVHQTMIALGLLNEGEKIAEQETGDVILYRIMAELTLLDEKYHVLQGGKDYAIKLLAASKEDQKIVDKIAYPTPEDNLGELEPDETIRDVAQGELLRAAQVYGILIANTIAAALPEGVANPDVQYGLLTEGSVLLKGKSIKKLALKTTQELLQLTYPPELIEADGDLGVAAEVMTQRHFAEAA